MLKNEKETKFNVKIFDDEIWEPDKDFLIQICEENSQQRMPGSDTQTKVTILDEDNPGKLHFEHNTLKVRRIDRTAFVRVVRSEGSDGDISCMYRICEMEGVESAAKEFDDFFP